MPPSYQESLRFLDFIPIFNKSLSGNDNHVYISGGWGNKHMSTASIDLIFKYSIADNEYSEESFKMPEKTRSHAFTGFVDSDNNEFLVIAGGYHVS